MLGVGAIFGMFTFYDCLQLWRKERQERVRRERQENVRRAIASHSVVYNDTQIINGQSGKNFAFLT